MARDRAHVLAWWETACGDARPTVKVATSFLVCAGGVERQADADDAGFAGFGGDDFEPAMVGFDDFAADGEAEAKADIAGGEKWRRGLFEPLLR